MNTQAKELSMAEWCRQHGVGQWSVAAQYEEQRRKDRDARREWLDAHEALARGEEGAEQRLAEALDYFRFRIEPELEPDEQERLELLRAEQADSADSSAAAAPVARTAAPAKTTTKRIVSSERTRYGGADVTETVIDVGGLLYHVREFPNGKKQVTRLDKLPGYVKRDASALDDSRNVEHWERR